MSKFSQDLLDSLTPRGQVFEIKEGPDFAIRVFPNGSKTWVFISTMDHCVQRRTLGIYPQMDIEQAHEALRQARRNIGARRVQTGAKNVIPTQGSVKKPAKKSASMLAGKLPIGMITAFLGIGVLLILQAIKDVQLTAEDSPKTSGFVKEKAPVPVVHSSVKVPLPQPAPISGLPRAIAASDEQMAEPVIPTTALTPGSASRNAATVAPSTAEPAVKRAQFTHGIEDREPIDRISSTLPPWDYKEGARPIFFFTEVAGLGGRTIYHRWELNGQVVSEIPFDVKSSWRWRVFSSKNMLPTMAGRWRVTVVDDLDNVLYTQDVKLPSRHLMSASNQSDQPAQLSGGR